MTAKYHCRKCGKRFVDWGAEKLGYKCPDCDGEELIRVGSPDDKTVRRPSLKRKPRVRPVPIPMEEEDLTIEDIEAEPVEEEAIYTDEEEEVEEEPEFLETETEPVEAEADEEALIEAEADFGTVTPTVGEDIDEALPESEEDWPA